MDAPLHHHRRHPTLPNGTTAVNPTEEIPSDPSSSRTIECPQSTTAIAKRKNKKKKQILVSDSASSASSNNCSCATSCLQKGIKTSRNPKRIRVGSLTTTRRSVGPNDVDALGLPLGMSIAAVVAQVFKFNFLSLFMCFCLKLRKFLLEIQVSLFLIYSFLNLSLKVFIFTGNLCVTWKKGDFYVK